MHRAWKGLALGVVLGTVAVGLIGNVESAAQSPSCQSTSDSSAHHLWDRPDGTPASNVLVTHHDYELSQNTTTAFADWVAYCLDGSTFSGPDRPRNLRLDPELDRDQQVSDADYESAHAEYGYDRGHLAPLATFEGSDNWSEVNFMSNIAPQHQTLNRGVWGNLEDAIRGIVSSDQPVYVLTGTAYDESMPSLPNASVSHRVPSDYWKIVATGEPSNPSSFHATAFLFDQHGCVVQGSCTFSRPFESDRNRVPVDRIEELTGFDFFSDLPQERQEQIESETGEWPPSTPDGDGDNGMASVVIAEMLPNPEGRNEPAEEWIQICNQGSEAADISDWELTDGEGNFEFPDGTTLEPDACVKIFGSDYNPSGDDSEMTLANSGDTVTLNDAAGNEVDVCPYGTADQGEVIDC